MKATEPIKLKWRGKNSRPKYPGWHYVRQEKNIGMRYYDDSKECWYLSTARDGFTPNHSFIEWLDLPGISDCQRD